MTPPVYTTGSWRPHPGHEDAFLAAWQEFAEWSGRMPGAGAALLARDLRDPHRFVSFVAWGSIDAIRAWKAAPEFKRRMSQVQTHVDKFAPTELEVVAASGSRAGSPTGPRPAPLGAFAH